MLLAELALGTGVLGFVLAGIAVRTLRGADASLVEAETSTRRYLLWSQERSRFVAARTMIADVAQAGTDTVRLGAGITRTGHRAIAGIPFGILAAIPATREGSRRVRDVHDGTAEIVYDAIDTISARIGEAVRRRMVGEQVWELPPVDHPQGEVVDPED